LGSAGRNAALFVGCLLIMTFSAGAVAGYVYAHEPSAPELRARLVPPAAVPDPVLRGTLVSVAPDFIEVSSADGPQRLGVTPALPVEELASLTGTIPDGAPVNVGGHRTESGFVITGVVVLAGGTP
jgi:hypothetical protein